MRRQSRFRTGSSGKSVKEHHMTHSHDDDHDRGLAHDLDIIARQMMGRRRALAWFAGVGASALVAGCGSGSAENTGSSSTTGATSGTASSTTTGGTGTTTTTNTTGSSEEESCVVSSSETAGPYPADGTNQSSGATSNVLTQSGIVRSDIRASFISSTTTAAGIQLTFTLTLVNVANSCAPLEGYAVYLWHCDIDGNYSLYSEPTESYLRGVQVTDANGQVTFTTIYPGCYDGRWPHIHFEVYRSLSTATGGRAALLTSQFAMPEDVSRTVYATSGYSSSLANLNRVSLSNDNVFGDNTTAQIAQQTPAITGTASAGYAATCQVGISA
jgi:protocatechuate 3,4-dioxygenase beta subunit